MRGVTVRSRSVIGNIGGAVQVDLRRRNITIYTKLAEIARQEAYDLLVAHAGELGANANPGDAATTPIEIMEGITGGAGLWHGRASGAALCRPSPRFRVRSTPASARC
ncbi:heavy metal-binding domain-containing protein [Caulobacter segnis]